MMWNTSIYFTLGFMDTYKNSLVFPGWIPKRRIWFAIDIGITINVEVMNMSKGWTIGRVAEYSTATLILPYKNMFWFNFILLNFKGEQESFTRLAPSFIRCPRFIRNSTKYESTSTSNHCNGCTLVVTLVMKISSLPSI